MDEHPDRRGTDRLRPLRPALKRPIGGPAERKKREPAKSPGKPADHPAAEPVERIGQTVARLGACNESVPAPPPRHSDEHEGPHIGERARALGFVEIQGAARRQANAIDRGENRVEFHALGGSPVSRPARLAPGAAEAQMRFDKEVGGMSEGQDLDAAYVELGDDLLQATALTRGPWHPDHQHAGPPSALIARSVERAGLSEGLTHLARLTVNLIRPVPIGECRIETAPDYVGRSAGHYSGRLTAEGKELARFTALVQREDELPLPEGTPGHPLPQAPKPPEASEIVRMPFRDTFGYGALVENRIAEGRFFDGPCAAWFRLNHPLVRGESPSPYQRVAVAADSGNGVSASLDFAKYAFVNCDLTINLLRRPAGEWICLQARTLLGGNGCGLAESALYDEEGLIGRATQSLAIRRR